MRAFLAMGLIGVSTTPASAQVTHLPTPAEIYPYTPERAVREGVTGRSTVRCAVSADGSLDACALVTESPMGQAFGMASIKAAHQLVKAQPPQNGGQATVDVPFTWNPH